MKYRLYKFYLFLTKAKRRLYSKVGTPGRLILFFTALSLLFGFNTRQTMIYQLAALFLMLLIFSFPFSFFFTPTLQLRRILPKTCTAGETLTYVLELENSGEKPLSGLMFTEESGAGYPSYKDFTTSPEHGEKDRNYVDRKLGYYRWLWLLKRHAGALFTSFPLPPLSSREHLRAEVSLLPLRRGYVQLAGYTIHRLDPLGLFKNEVFIKDAQKLLVLPKMFPVVQADLIGARKYHQGGLTSAAGCGESGDFVSLREYRSGDPVKNIDWKVSARARNTIVRQYQEEFFSRYGILLDTFTEQQSSVFEDAVSVAASIIVQQDTSRNLIDLLFACDSCISSVSMGPGQSDRQTILEVLACTAACHDQEFSHLADMVMAHTRVLSGLILVLVKMDDQRRQLMDYLQSVNIPHKIILISESRAESEDQLRHMSLLHQVRVFDVRSENKLVDLS